MLLNANSTVTINTRISEQGMGLREMQLTMLAVRFLVHPKVLSNLHIYTFVHT
jgi:hypothetical protein